MEIKNSKVFWESKKNVLLNSFPTLSSYLSECIANNQIESMEKFLLALFVSDVPMEDQKEMPN